MDSRSDFVTKFNCNGNEYNGGVSVRYNSVIISLPLFTKESCCLRGMRGGLLVSALDFGASGPGSSPGWSHCVVFLGMTLNSHSASLHPGVSMGTGKLLGKT